MKNLNRYAYSAACGVDLVLVSIYQTGILVCQPDGGRNYSLATTDLRVTHVGQTYRIAPLYRLALELHCVATVDQVPLLTAFSV
ncbi:MAG TPA: hypothetical protein DC031_00110 [Sulfitobacter sp.]|jgi:hypothetical protein|uniref:hypothetical protein n=1 Tax=Sulfitobacter dubius TaxID=218673 RepID=UPI000C4349F2|nr:hypothetical protein [Sulfitobacter sp.]HBB81692.1 hypothetical protein [Sulfitobacter sp.]|tara:strand:- start:588 stop:839 length:252 start_codon:yes stop_codon:yes gene_type:complete